MDENVRESINQIANALRHYESEEVASMIIRGMERWSIEREKGIEVELRTLIFSLREKLDARLLSI